jgi:hypothetical protein
LPSRQNTLSTSPIRCRRRSTSCIMLMLTVPPPCERMPCHPS